MTTEPTGAMLELQQAIEKIKTGHADLGTAFISAGTASAASVLVLAFNRIEAQQQEINDLKARVSALEARPCP